MNDPAIPLPGAIARGLYKDQQRADAARVKSARIIAGADVNSPIEGEVGYQHRAIQNSGYVAREGESFVRRAIPKVKGKAAAKAAKKARHAARKESQRVGNS